MYVCPHCQKEVKNLKEHIKRMHPDVASDGQNNAENNNGGSNSSTDNQDLELDLTGVDHAEAKSYHCVDCGGSVSYHQANCPHCGTKLDWGEL